jgi:hypothetical protein
MLLISNSVLTGMHPSRRSSESARTTTRPVAVGGLPVRDEALPAGGGEGFPPGLGQPSARVCQDGSVQSQREQVRVR